MCRHLAYLGAAVTLRSVLTDPPHGLQARAWAPRRQRHGVVNADGFGVGWYADGDPVPARYRRAQGGPAADADAARPAAAVGTGAGTEVRAARAGRNGKKASQ
jgi:glutamine amidotransferase